MRIILLICFISFALSACRLEKDPGSNIDVSILNDAFMDMIDTIPYRYHSLRPAPNDSIYAGADSLNVAINPFLTNIRKWKREITSPNLKAVDKARILTLFEKSIVDSFQLEISVDSFNKTGRYKLFPHRNQSISIDTLSAIGKIEFTRTYFDEQYAITIATIRDQFKNGVVKLFLLEKRNGKWQKKEEFILEIW